MLNWFGNIPPQNKDTEVVSVRKNCLIKLFLSILLPKKFESTEFEFCYSRKYKWSKHHFSIWSSGKSWRILAANQFLVSTIFLTDINIYFFNLCSDLFSIIGKKVNQIRSNEARLIFLVSPCNTFNIFLKNRSFLAHISRLCYSKLTLNEKKMTKATFNEEDPPRMKEYLKEKVFRSNKIHTKYLKIIKEKIILIYFSKRYLISQERYSCGRTKNPWKFVLRYYKYYNWIFKCN